MRDSTVRTIQVRLLSLLLTVCAVVQLVQGDVAFGAFVLLTGLMLGPLSWLACRIENREPMPLGELREWHSR